MSARLIHGQPSGLCEVDRSGNKPDRDAKRSERADGEGRLEGVGDCRHESDFAQRETEYLHLPEFGKTQTYQHEAYDGQQWSDNIHKF